ncbi:MAG: hypothetical protein K6T74_10900 [Geminicoccaceae bacterium]|nr:hypothetical protein [Geminicoccaceae bacterium]
MRSGRVLRQRAGVRELASGHPVAAAPRPLSFVVRSDEPLDFALLGVPEEVRFARAVGHAGARLLRSAP